MDVAPCKTSTGSIAAARDARTWWRRVDPKRHANIMVNDHTEVERVQMGTPDYNRADNSGMCDYRDPRMFASRTHGNQSLQLAKDFDEAAALKKWNSRRYCELGCWLSHEVVREYADVQAKKMCECCHAAFYCSRECQKIHWPMHKMNCGKPGIARQYRGKAFWYSAVQWRGGNGFATWFPLVVHCDDTVDDVKEMILRKFDLPISDQVLKVRLPMMREDLAERWQFLVRRDQAGFVEIKMGRSFCRLPGTGTGTLADFENSHKEILVLETECSAPPPTCQWCRQCIGGACRLEAGPEEADAADLPAPAPAPPRPKPAARRNDPCPCGSGRKYKACCGGK